MLNLKFWPPYPFFAKRKNFRTWQPCPGIWHSCLSEVGESVTNRFFAPKNLQSQIFRLFRLLVQDFLSLKGFFEKINDRYLRFVFFFFAVLGQKFKIPLPMFCSQLKFRKPHRPILKTVGGDRFSVNFYFFTKTGNSANLQNVLNRCL